MAGTAVTDRSISLHTNAFFVLGVTTRDSRHTIVRRAEEKSLEFDQRPCQQARSELTNPRTRLTAEIAWLPGVSPNRAAQLAQRACQGPGAISSERGLPVLAQANLLTAAFETLGPDVASAQVEAAIHELAALVDRLDPEDVLRDVDEDRAVAGFPAVAGLEHVERELASRTGAIRNALRDTLDRLSTEAIIDVMTNVVNVVTDNGEHGAPALIDQLVDAYEVEAHEFLEKEAANIQRLLKAAREAAPRDRVQLHRVLRSIAAVAKNWDRVAQPIQLSAKARGVSHPLSNSVAFEIRDLSVDLFNLHDFAQESKQLNDLLQEVFAEVPHLVERAEEDASALETIIGSRREWAREIGYSAEVGVAFKHTLSISPEGVSWKGASYSLREVSRIRWGGVKHSVNGIPTGTTYTVAFGNQQAESVVELRQQDVYSTFTDKLWRAVGPRLIDELLTALKAGQHWQLNGAVLSDGGISFSKYKLLGPNETVQCTWDDVHVWSADGSFCIGAKNDSKAFVALSYIHHPNAHVLEQVIRVAFERGVDRLSDLMRE